MTFPTLSYRDVIDIVEIVLQFEITTQHYIFLVVIFLMIQGHHECTRYISNMDDLKAKIYIYNKTNNMNLTLKPPRQSRTL